MHLSGLYIYPVKSLRGISVSSADIDALGLVGDRRFLIVDEMGQPLTQRALPHMALVETELTPTHLILRASAQPPCVIPRLASRAPAVKIVSVWKSEDLATEDCGDDPATWLTSFLGVPCRLVRIGNQFNRPVLDTKRARVGDVLTFADGYPFLVTSESSLADLNDRLIERGEQTIPMDRFRPNFVITGCPAFAEDQWPRVSINRHIFRAGGPCSRCIITTTDQLTAERTNEPLRTLATYRRGVDDPTSIHFGQNLIHETKSGTLHIGDTVTLL